jgi:hypothetical protein
MLAATVLIGVFGLFRPTELVLRPAPGQALVVEAGASRMVLEGRRTLQVRATDLAESSLRAAVRGGGEFFLGVPGKIERRFRGELRITVTEGALVAVVAMDREVAVASAVAAESPPGASLEASPRIRFLRYHALPVSARAASTELSRGDCDPADPRPGARLPRGAHSRAILGKLRRADAGP